ncbi:short-chain dehydrogenase, partial [Sphingomonas sp. HMWF008]
ERHYAVNLSAPVLLASALAVQDDLAEGAVVNILDQKLANPNPDFFSYSCAKFALGGATTMLAQALGPRIRVNAVSPGLSLPSADQTEAEFAAAAARNLLRRPVDPQDIARAVAFLLEARGVQGQNVFVDCGQRFLPRTRDVMFEDRMRAQA